MDIETGLLVELNSIYQLKYKVFPVTSIQNTSTPYLIYTLSRNDRVGNLQGVDGLIESEYQIDIYDSSYKNLKDLSKSVIDLLLTLNQKNIGDTQTYIQQIEIINEFNFYENEVQLYRQTIEFIIHYKE